jgi:hypothetical protein
VRESKEDREKHTRGPNKGRKTGYGEYVKSMSRRERDVTSVAKGAGRVFSDYSISRSWKDLPWYEKEIFELEAAKLNSALALVPPAQPPRPLENTALTLVCGDKENLLTEQEYKLMHDAGTWEEHQSKWTRR